MLGYMDETAYEQTKSTRKVTFFSRSKQRLWVKGETSGNFLHLVSMELDCDQDTILVMAQPQGPTCHTGADTCFMDTNNGRASFLHHLEQVIAQRQENPSEQSYTSSLFKKGINKIAQKVGEEAVEIVIEAKDDNKALFLNEGADLLFHFMVLLRAKGYSLDEVLKVLEERHK